VRSSRTAAERIVTSSDQKIFTAAMIDVDADGRITLADAATLAPWLGAVSRGKTKPEPLPNTNCDGCNTVKGCGPVNVVAGCSGKLRE